MTERSLFPAGSAAAVFSCTLAICFFVSVAAAQTFEIQKGTNMIGLPGLSFADFSSCVLRYFDSNTRAGCHYSRDGTFVYYNQTDPSGDCASKFHSSSAMATGYGYYVSANETCTVTFTPKTTMDITLYQGTNILAVPVTTTTDQIAAACGGTKDSLFQFYDSSTRAGCKYNDAGYFVYYNTTNSSGDCGTNFHSSSVLQPYLGYYVSFKGFGGDGATPCQLRYVNGLLQMPAIVTTTSTTSFSTTTTMKATTTTTIRASTTTTSAKSTTTTTIAPGSYSENAVWIQDSDVGGNLYMNNAILTTNLPKVISDLQANHIKYAFINIGYFSGNNIGYTRHTDAFYIGVIKQLHAAGIKAIAWVESAQWSGAVDIRAANRQNVYDTVSAYMGKYQGADWWDGYNDDVEYFTGTQQDQIDYLNGFTPVLHGLGKIMTADLNTDNGQNIFQHLKMDYIVVMFYGTTSKLESSEAAAFFQECFGEYSGHNTPPASPIIFGVMNYNGNAHPLSWQLSQLSSLLKSYKHPNLAGFSVWLYEYMGTAKDDWQQWNSWITATAAS